MCLIVYGLLDQCLSFDSSELASGTRVYGGVEREREKEREREREGKLDVYTSKLNITLIDVV
jgi:hypothetical protein